MRYYKVNISAPDDASLFFPEISFTTLIDKSGNGRQIRVTLPSISGEALSRGLNGLHSSASTHFMGYAPFLLYDTMELYGYGMD